MNNVLDKSSWVELTNEELMTINGGIRIPGPYGWIISGVIWVIDEWDDISAGFERGYNDAVK